MITAILIASTLLAPSWAYRLAPQSHRSKPFTVAAEEYPCAYNSAQLDQLNLEERRSGATVTIISRLGDGERSRNLARKRLRVAREYTYLEDDRVRLKEGPRVKGFGRLEFYLGDELFFASEMLAGYEFCPND